MLLFIDAQYTSPYAMSVFVGLKEKGIPFDMQTVDLGAGANHAPDYADKSLTQRVPTLIDGDFHCPSRRPLRNISMRCIRAWRSTCRVQGEGDGPA